MRWFRNVMQSQVSGAVTVASPVSLPSVPCSLLADRGVACTPGRLSMWADTTLGHVASGTVNSQPGAVSCLGSSCPLPPHLLTH